MLFEKAFKVPEVPWKSGFRKACRWVIIDKNGQIPLLFDSYKKYYKLPWWWIEWKEDKVEAFRREVKEEAWCEIEYIKEIWIVTEESSNWKQISYCFIWEVVSKWEAHFTKKELDRWYQLKWVSLDEALSFMKDSLQATEDGKMKQERDLFILGKAIEELDERYL